MIKLKFTPCMIMLYMCCIAMIIGCSKNIDPVYRFQGRMNVGEWTRTFLVNLPDNFYEEDGQFPLVVALHGTGGSALQCERDYGLTVKAMETNWVIVYPEGVPRPGPFGIRTWNAGTCCDYAFNNNVDDVGFVRSVIDEMVRAYKVDPNRVYVTGMSNGGMMSYRLACELSDKINAIALVSGSMVTSSCNPSEQVPILHIHSELDEIVPYYGGEGLGGYRFPAMDSVFNVWSELNECSGVIEETYSNYSYKKWTCDAGVMIEHYLTKDGGHSWPGGLIARPGADEPSTAIDATEIIWEFFERN